MKKLLYRLSIISFGTLAHADPQTYSLSLTSQLDDPTDYSIAIYLKEPGTNRSLKGLAFTELPPPGNEETRTITLSQPPDPPDFEVQLLHDDKVMETRLTAAVQGKIDIQVTRDRQFILRKDKPVAVNEETAPHNDSPNLSI